MNAFSNISNKLNQFCNFYLTNSFVGWSVFLFFGWGRTGLFAINNLEMWKTDWQQTGREMWLMSLKCGPEIREANFENGSSFIVM